MFAVNVGSITSDENFVGTVLTSYNGKTLTVEFNGRYGCNVFCGASLFVDYKSAISALPSDFSCLQNSSELCKKAVGSSSICGTSKLSYNFENLNGQPIYLIAYSLFGEAGCECLKNKGPVASDPVSFFVKF